jgi:tetratricopeptide (TPR) repeat protein
VRQAFDIAQNGDNKRALALTNALLLQRPDFVPALKLQGMLLEDMGHSLEASASYQKALTLAPDDDELLLKLGILRLSAGKPDESIDFLRRRLKLHPQDGEALYYLAEDYHLKGENEKALGAIQKCVKAEPDNASVWQKYGELLCSSGESKEALRWLLKAQEQDPKLEWIDYDLGVASFYSMDMAGAAKYAERAAEIQPDNANVLELLAAALLKLSRWQDAEGIFERILVLKKNDTASLLGLGHCELELKQYQASLDTLDNLLQLDPTQALAHFFMARDLNALGRIEEAQHEQELHHMMMDQLSFAPQKEEAIRQKAILEKARQLLAEHREDDAIRMFQVSSNGGSATQAQACVFVGAVYLSMGLSSDALRNLNRALLIDPKARGAHVYRGILDLQQGDLVTAERELHSEMIFDPNHPLAMAELGEVRYRQGRWSEAASLLAKSKTTAPALLYLLCDSYFHIGNIDGAKLTAEGLAAYARNEPGVMQGLYDLLNRNGQAELAKRLTPDSGK